MNLDDLPVEIVPALVAFGRALAKHIREHRDGSLEEHETGVVESWHTVAPAFLVGTLKAATTGLALGTQRLRAPCPECGERLHALDSRSRDLNTRVGPISLERPWHHCRACHRGWSPADGAWKLAPYQRTSDGLRRWEGKLGGITTFAEAQGLLAEFTGVFVGVETLRTHAEQIGTELEGVQQVAMAHVAANQEPPADYELAPGSPLLVETDGVMVHYSEDGLWHEVKLGIVAGWQERELQMPSYVAAREPAAAWARRLNTEAARRGALDVVGSRGAGGHEAILRAVDVVGDGAKWIWDEVGASFDQERTETVDWFHGCEHLWKLARSVFGSETPEATTWVEQAKHRLWHHGAGPLLEWLTETRPPTPEATAVMRTERGYFTTNAARMDYPTLRRRGLPVGSGPVESAAKHLVQHRLKRAGMRWSDLGARAILNLRCHLLSGRVLPVVRRGRARAA